MDEKRVCRGCSHFQSGDLDRRTNWMSCDKGHCLVSEEELQEYHSDLDPDTVYRVDRFGWVPMSSGSGELMLSRSDCPDWEKRGFRSDLGNPEYV